MLAAYPQRWSRALEARKPEVAARSIRATGRPVRTRSPATTTDGSGVLTVGRSA
ncbi:hypothetical protein OIM90_30045 [Streptomyces sp. AD16]|nr:hypothetical protein OIM90_30045 [Streptomyces sp. AD16]